MRFFGLLSFVALASAHDFKQCSSGGAELGVTEVDVNPDPAVAGQTLEVKIVGKTTAAIAAGTKSRVGVKVFGVEIAHLDLDFCKDLGVSCPLAAGAEWAGKINYPIPSAAPGGITASIEITTTGADGSAVDCIDLQEKIVKSTELFGAEEASKQFLFTQWSKQFGKNYEVEDMFNRYSIFTDNFAKIADHNNAGHSWTMAMNEFGDLTAEEFGGRYKGLLPQRSEYLRSQNAPDKLLGFKPMASVDWVSKGAVTPVKNQGQCGSCWAFSTTGSIEGAHQIATNKLISLSEQQLVDCAGSAGNQGCNGGLMDYGFEWVIKNGICLEGDYPYTAKKSLWCKKKCTVAAHITGYKDVTKGDEDALMQAVNLTPVSIAIEADQSAFQFYSGGVMDGTCGKKLDHGVLLVGYGTDSGKDYWKVKNSWGASWGEEGYIRMIRGQDQCGLADSASYPTGASQVVPTENQ